MQAKDFDPITGSLKDKGWRIKTWDADNHLLTDKNQANGLGSTCTFYGDGTLFRNDDDTNGAASRTTTEYAYNWWDGPVQSEIKVVWQLGAASNQFVDGFSKFEYDGNGRLLRMFNPTAGKQQMVQYLSDASGQILERKEYGGPGSTLRYDAATGTVLQADNPVWVRYYYADGHRIGEINNTGAPLEQQDYAQEMARAPAKGNDAKHRIEGPQMWADFDQSYQPINSGYPSAAAPNYLVRKGDTLRSIAQAVWGDANLWYLIAEANGLVGNESTTEGMTLWIPNKVVNVHTGAGTYKVYDPGAAIGNTNPLLPDPPPPPGKGGCGGLAMIIVIVVAVVVTVFTAGAAAMAMAGTLSSFTAGAATTAGASALAGGSLAAAAIGGAVGSIVSQGVAMAAGIQDSFSWSSVGMSAVGSMVGAGMGAAAGGGGAAGNALANAGTIGRAVLGNVLTQGIGVAVGLQKKFDWRGVAASAVSAGVGEKVGEWIGNAQYDGEWTGMSPEARQAHGATDWGNTLVRAVGAGVVAGAASSVTRGRRVDWNDVTRDAVGAAVGNLIADQIKASVGKDSSYAQDDAATRFGPSAMLTFPDLSRMGGGEFGDGSAPPFSRPEDDTLLAAGEGFTMGRGPVSVGQRGRTVFITDQVGQGSIDSMLSDARARLEALKQQVAIDRGLTNISEMAEAYRASGMVGATGDVTVSEELPIYLGADGRGHSTPQPPIEITGSRVPEAALVRAQLQAQNDAQNIEGNYNKFSAMADAVSSGNWSQAWFHFNYAPSGAARQAVYDRVFPPPDTRFARVDAARGGVFGAVAVLATQNASARDQYYAAQAGTHLDALSGAMSGVYRNTLTAQAPIPVALGSRLRGAGGRLDVGNVDSFGSLLLRTGDGSVHRDHIPSKAALLERAEVLKDARLSPTERNRIISESEAVTVPAEVHRLGPSYGQTRSQIQSDAADLAQARIRDAAAMVSNARTRVTPQELEALLEAQARITARDNSAYDAWLRARLDPR